MLIFALIISAILGFAWWSGKLTMRQMPAVLLMVAGAGLAARGLFIYGVGAIAVGALWFSGRSWLRRSPQKSKAEEQREISEAQRILGVSAHDNAADIRARHRSLMTQNHPDTGGSEKYAQQLNAARDLLLDNLAKREQK